MNKPEKEAATGGPGFPVECLVVRHCPWCEEEDSLCACMDDVDEDGYDCTHCDDGVLLVCCDDLCHGQGWCMHGDGEVICHHCDGTGFVRHNAQAHRKTCHSEAKARFSGAAPG